MAASNPHPPAALYRSLPRDAASRIGACVRAAVSRRADNDPMPVFFRADDIGVPGRSFSRLLQVFGRYSAPLSLAVVPAWLTGPRWAALCHAGPAGTSALWCWHQHGWRHRNHETLLKKQEFGPSRDPGAIENDIRRGRHRLEAIMGPHFFPLFTPPWNRCSQETLAALKKLDFRAISRFRGARPDVPDGLQDVPVHVDLHTRKEADPQEGWNRLLAELEAALATGRCGIMIHHQRMNPAAFAFLDTLLDQLSHARECRIVDVREMIGPVRREA